MNLANNKRIPNNLKIKSELQELVETEDEHSDISEKLIKDLIECVMKNYPDDLFIPSIGEIVNGGIGLDWDIDEDVVVSLDILKGCSNGTGKFKTLSMDIIDLTQKIKTTNTQVEINSKKGWLNIKRIVDDKIQQQRALVA